MEEILDVLWPVLGVLAGFALGWLAKLAVERRDESRALNELVTYLHLKRSLAPIDPQPAPVGNGELRCRTSIQDIREKIVETLAHVRAASDADEVLMRMTGACNRYLRNAFSDPERYQFELMELRQNLDEDLRILTDGRRSVTYLSPGERAEALAAAGPSAPSKSPKDPSKK